MGAGARVDTSARHSMSIRCCDAVKCGVSRPVAAGKAMPMELNHLRSFVTIARFGHLTRAAEALHLSQPALSGHVKVLEEKLGVSLFDRTPTGMALTPAGERLVVEAEAILAAVAHLAQSAQA